MDFPEMIKMLGYDLLLSSDKVLSFSRRSLVSLDTAQRPEGIEMTPQEESDYVPLLHGSKVTVVPRQRLPGWGFKGPHW